MSKNKFAISDTHFGHQNILNFKKEDGTPVRDFDSLEDMHETMVKNWNSVLAEYGIEIVNVEINDIDFDTQTDILIKETYHG